MPRHNANLAIHLNSHRFNEIQQIFLIQPTDFAIFATVCGESFGKVCGESFAKVCGGIWWGGEKCVTL